VKPWRNYLSSSAKKKTSFNQARILLKTQKTFSQLAKMKSRLKNISQKKKESSLKKKGEKLPKGKHY
jgi:hypothetical protein